MGRIITKERAAEIRQARLDKPEALGPALAELIIDGGIPVSGVATLLAVSEPTIYRWMYGQAEPRDADKIAKVKKLLALLRKARRAKDTPLNGSTKEREQKLIELVIKYKPAPT